MNLIRYYPGMLTNHYAAVPVGGKAVIVNRESHYPVGAIIGMPERWKRFITPHTWEWRSPATMPNSAIRLRWKVMGTRVCQIEGIDEKEWYLMGIPLSSFQDELCGNVVIFEEVSKTSCKDWYTSRYPKGNLDKDWVEVTEIERM